MSNAITTRPINLAAQAILCTAAERRAGDLLAFLEQPAAAVPQLIEPAELILIRAELCQALTAPPAEEREARAEIMTLIGSFPRKPDDPAIYLAVMAKEAERWPADVVRDARRVLVRTLKFLPTVAELAEACETIQARRRMLLTAAERMERENQRRASQRQQRDRLEAERRAELENLHTALRIRFGALAIDVSAYADALEAFRYAGNLLGDFRGAMAAAWAFAYRRAEPWAVVAGQRAAIFGRALRLYRTDVFRLGHLYILGQALAQNNEEGVTYLVQQAEAGVMPLTVPPVADRNALRSCLAAALDQQVCQRVADARGIVDPHPY